MRGLQGKVAIVTGAARGLGAAVARRLAAEGVSVLLADVLEDGETIAQSLRDEGANTAFLTLDVADPSAWSHAVALAEARFGGVDILVNNAGISMVGHIEEISLDTFQRVLDVNLIGAFLGIKASIPAMRRRGGGSIITLSSAATRVVVPAACAYGASKAALANLTKTTAVHCGRSNYNIRVNSVHPGPTETKMLLDGMKDVDPAVVAQMHKGIPLGRLGVPDDIAGVVAFLASDDSAYMTGEEVFVDGGLNIV
jgi:3alpha(or 20beta)-hydroxysteroid dehydrogenase